MKVKRIQAGEYKVTIGEYSLTVSYVCYPHDQSWYWIVGGEGTTFDPFNLKRDALQAIKDWYETR